MDQDRAKKLFDYGATFVFLDVPEGTEFGMDCNVWTVGPKFKGVKMIPPGLHFIHFRCVVTLDLCVIMSDFLAELFRLRV